MPLLNLIITLIVAVIAVIPWILAGTGILRGLSSVRPGG